jgi:hypothetical protein
MKVLKVCLFFLLIPLLEDFSNIKVVCLEHILFFFVKNNGG